MELAIKTHPSRLSLKLFLLYMYTIVQVENQSHMPTALITVNLIGSWSEESGRLKRWTPAVVFKFYKHTSQFTLTHLEWHLGCDISCFGRHLLALFIVFLWRKTFIRQKAKIKIATFNEGIFDYYSTRGTDPFHWPIFRK